MISNLTPGNNNAVKINALSYAIVLRALYDGPCTMADLIEISGCGEWAIRGYLKALRHQNLVRVCDKLKNVRGAKTIPVYEWAPDKKDAVIKYKTHAERSRDYHQRKKIKELINGLTNSIEAG